MLNKIKSIIDSDIFILSSYFSVYLLIVYSIFLSVLPQIAPEKLVFILAVIPLIYINSKIINFLRKSWKLIRTHLDKKNMIFYAIIFLIIAAFLFSHEWNIFIKLTILFFSIALILVISHRLILAIAVNIIFLIQIALMMQDYPLANIISTYLYYFLAMGFIAFLLHTLFDKKNPEIIEEETTQSQLDRIWEDKIYTDISILWFAFFIVFMFLLKNLRFEMNGFWSITMMIIFIASWLFWVWKLDVKKMLKNQILKYIMIALFIPYIYFFIGFILPFFR